MPDPDFDGIDGVEQEQGRATRARTRLIVEGFSNLALVAILFTGVQAQLISVANDSGDEAPNNLSIATNAVFFGGLIFSVFTTMLATLSGRWFSILREDDSDYLSSCWLSQDCAELGDKRPDLEKYLDYQIESIKADIHKELAKSKAQPPNGVLNRAASPNATSEPSIANEKSNRESSSTGATSPQRVVSPQHPATNNAQIKRDSALISDDSGNPIVEDLKRIIRLLQVEKKEGEILPIAVSSRAKKAPKCKNLKVGRTTIRERILSLTLLSALAASVASFLLFCAGIVMLAWNKQPRAVAIFTSACVLVCVIPLLCFFLRHRHKHVIKHLHLGRPGL